MNWSRLKVFNVHNVRVYLYVAQKDSLNWDRCAETHRLNQTLGLWQACGITGSCQSEANTPKGLWIQKSTFQVVPRLRCIISLTVTEIHTSSLSLIFHFWLRTLDCRRAQSIRHKAVFSKICQFHYQPVKSPPCCLFFWQDTGSLKANKPIRPSPVHFSPA